eukprot:scaffold2655_cov179-Amphora_coffeaeformis.AAC.26
MNGYRNSSQHIVLREGTNYLGARDAPEIDILYPAAAKAFSLNGDRLVHQRTSASNVSNVGSDTIDKGKMTTKYYRETNAALTREASDKENEQGRSVVGKTTIDATCKHGQQSCLIRNFEKHNNTLKQDTVVLRTAVSTMEIKLIGIQKDRNESLARIKEQKKRDMIKICLQCMTEYQLSQSLQKKEQESYQHHLVMLSETIKTLRDTNQTIRSENKELTDNIQELKDDNKRLVEVTASLYMAIQEVKYEIELAEAKQVDLKKAEQSLRSILSEYERSLSFRLP